MEELEQKLSYENDQVRFNNEAKTWGMRDGPSGQRFEQTEQSVHSNSLDEKLRSLDEKIQKSDEKLKKLGRRKGVVGDKYIQIGQTEIGLRNKPGRGRFYSKASSRLINKANTGVVRMRLRTAGQEDYKKKHSRQRRLENRAARKGRLLFRAAEALDDDSLKADERDAFPDAVKAGRKSGRLAYAGARRLTHRLLEANSVYRRFDAELQHNRRLQAERKRLSARAEENAKRGKKYFETYKRRRKKQQVIEHQQEGFRRRTIEFRKKAKKTRERVGRTKRILTALASGTGIVLLAAGAVIILLYAVLALIDSGTSIGISFISMNDYGVMTECTDFFNDKCTNLYMYLNIERDKNIEPDLMTKLGGDIYEFVYDVDVPITYSQIDLIAYLSAKYGSFTLDMVKTELAEIFAQMFEIEAVIKVESREVPDPVTGGTKSEDKNICYVTLKVTGFDDVVAGRLTDGQKNSYLGYRLSSCGQQVMNPVMEENWTDLISSPFGSRYHPIHKEYRMHNGVDIAVPTGTKVYAAVSGEVTAARYSDSAGYMVSVTDDKGYTVTYMHLSNYSVAVGQKITAGEFLALSGNSGNSTGPHLHLAVQDADGNYLNPVFMIPQTCVKQ